MKRKFFTNTLILIAAISIIGCSDTNKFEVESKKGTTYITVPSYMSPSDELTKILVDEGFVEADIEGDESVTYSILDEDYDNFISKTEENIHEYIDDINNSNNHPSVLEIKIDENMNTITATIDTDIYKDSDDELVVNALALKVLHLKAYKGDKLSVKVKLINQSNDNVYDVVTIQQ